MKIKDGFIMRKVAGDYIVVATGETSREFHGMVKLNETGKAIWEGVEAGKSQAEIVDMLAVQCGAESASDRAVIADDVAAMLQEMSDAGFLTE